MTRMAPSVERYVSRLKRASCRTAPALTLAGAADLRRPRVVLDGF